MIEHLASSSSRLLPGELESAAGPKGGTVMWHDGVPAVLVPARTQRSRLA
jgi:hypothetical protein